MSYVLALIVRANDKALMLKTCLTPNFIVSLPQPTNLPFTGQNSLTTLFEYWACTAKRKTSVLVITGETTNQMKLYHIMKGSCSQLMVCQLFSNSFETLFHAQYNILTSKCVAPKNSLSF